MEERKQTMEHFFVCAYTLESEYLTAKRSVFDAWKDVSKRGSKRQKSKGMNGSNSMNTNEHWLMVGGVVVALITEHETARKKNEKQSH